MATRAKEARVAKLIEEAQGRLDWAVKAQADFVTEERQHRITRRRREHAIREANPKLPASAIDLLLEADKDYLTAFTQWSSAQVTRKRADGEYEIAKMAVWAAIRGLD